MVAWHARAPVGGPNAIAHACVLCKPYACVPRRLVLRVSILDDVGHLSPSRLLYAETRGHATLAALENDVSREAWSNKPEAWSTVRAICSDG